jgi:hypothetical protein
MIEAVSTMLMGIVVVFGGMYCALRWIVLAGPPERRA